MKKEHLLEKLLSEKKSESERSFYEHMVESVDSLTFFEKLYLMEYLSSSIVTEMDEFFKLNGESE